MAFDIWKFLWYFMLASFCGWLSEVAYNAIVHKNSRTPACSTARTARSTA